MRNFLLILAMLVPAAPAAADLTATYVNRRGIETIVEVNDAGLARIGTNRKEEGEGRPDYSIFRPEGDFFVFYRGDLPAVVSWDVFRRVIHHNVRTMSPVAASPMEGPTSPGAEKPRTPLVRLPPLVGEVMVDGRRGTVYLGAGTTAWDRHHWIVISRDRELRPLTTAFSRFFRSRPDYFEFPDYGPNQRLHQLDALMAEGAPLAFGDLQLVSVNFGAVPGNRFELPAKPLTAQAYQAIIGSVSIGPASAPAEPKPVD